MWERHPFSLPILLWDIPSIGGGIDGAMQWFDVYDCTKLLSAYIWQPSNGNLWLWVMQWITHLGGNSRVPKTVRHITSLHRICPKLLIESSTSRLEYQTSLCRPTVELFGSSPIQLEPQTSVRWPTLKQFSLSPSRLEYQASVRWMSMKLFGSSTSYLSFDRRRNCWLISQPSVLWPAQPLTTHIRPLQKLKCRQLSAPPKTRIATMSSLSY